MYLIWGKSNLHLLSGFSRFSRIRTGYGQIPVKMHTRITPNTDSFYAVIVRVQRDVNIKVWRELDLAKTDVTIYSMFKDSLSCLIQFLATQSSLKMMKNIFISPQKVFAFSRYLSFCLDFLVIYQNGFSKKIKLISNFMTSQPG